jgi:hypothetical protein
MSDQRPDPPTLPPPARGWRALTVVMIAVGVLLLLPGACALFFIASFIVSEGSATLRAIRAGDPLIQMILVVWGVCILVSLFGVWMLRRARD